ncbi:MAG: ABC transporter substrate-binding protein [Chloroflexota bacterium]
MTRRLRLVTGLACLGAVLLPGSSLAQKLTTAHTFRVGAIYPLTGSQAIGGVQEYRGVRTAATLVNQAGGIHGKRIVFDTVNVPSADAAPAAIDDLKRRGIRLVLGSYGSTISLPASAEAQHDGLIFWESGAVATMITQRGFPDVFRTVTTGNSLGRAAARYAATVVAPRLRLTPRALRTAVVYVNDPYGSSVGRAMEAEARTLGFRLMGVLPYDPYHVHMRTLVSRLKAMRPDIVLVTGYVQDAVAFRKETLRQHLHPAAMIGTSSAFCMHAFGNTLGARALGLFASDKPDASFSSKALLPPARVLRSRAEVAFRKAYHASMTAPAVAGFVAGWVLFHDVLWRTTSAEPAAIRTAALSLNLPFGSEINGAGVRFAPPGAPDAGQNLRAISVIWQWQRPGHEVVVYPPAYATAKPRWVPLPGWRH